MDWYPLWNSLRIAGISCVIVFFLGIYAAHRIATLPRLVKGVLDVLLTLPLVLPPTVCGWILLLIFGLTHPVGIFLKNMGIQFVMTWYGGVIASAVVAFPLMYRTARGALKALMKILPGAPVRSACRNGLFSGVSVFPPANRALLPVWSSRLPGRSVNTARQACLSAIFPAIRRPSQRLFISSGVLMTSTARSFG